MVGLYRLCVCRVVFYPKAEQEVVGGQEVIWYWPGHDCPGRMGLIMAYRGLVDQLPDMVDDEICWRYKEIVHSCKRCSDEVLALASAGFCDHL